MRRNKKVVGNGNNRYGRIVVDCAGAIKGGAARFLRELQAYLEETSPKNVELIGLGKQLTPQWLIKRELIAFTAQRRISLNNAGFLNPTGHNITLLRNILQFATQADLEALKYEPPLRLRAQIPVVRTLAKFSDTLVVPCTRMAEKVRIITPSLQEKLTVRFHPVSQPDWAGTPSQNSRDVLMPIVPSPYKNLEQHISEFLDASKGFAGEPVCLVVPSTESDMPEFATNARVKFIGTQTSQELELWWRDSGAVFFPTEFESFGYPLAEARVYGRNVIAQDTAQNREIAGPALNPYKRHDSHSLREAIEKATADAVPSDPAPFSPTSYFKWLLEGEPLMGSSSE